MSFVMIKVWEGLGGIPTVIQYTFTAKRAPLRVAYALRIAVRMRIRRHRAYTHAYTDYVVLLCIQYPFVNQAGVGAPHGTILCV